MGHEWPMAPGRPTQSVVRPASRGSLALIGELLPTNGRFHHHSPDGLHDHGYPVDEVRVRSDARLQYHGRSTRREAELACLEALQGGLMLEHEELAEALAPHLRAHRFLRQIAVADVLAALVHHPSAIGPAHAE